MKQRNLPLTAPVNRKIQTDLMNRITLALLFLFFASGAAAQSEKPLTVSGYVRDKTNGEALINATLTVPEARISGQSNAYGYYSLSLPAGKYTLIITYTGFSRQTHVLELKQDEKLDFLLEPQQTALQEVVVQGEKKIRRSNTVALGVQQLDVAQIKRMPAFMGEPDVIKAILTMPGITSVGEGASGFNVRGGNVDENLIIMDEAPVYNASHLLGFFSVFNPDAVKNVTIYKSAFPAEYGGRTSSVLDIRMKDGNNQEYTVNGGIGNIFSRVSIEGPLQKDRSSFILAGRRSYIDVLAKPFLNEENKNSTMYFYDLTLKANYQVNASNTVFLSGYFGRDVFGFNKEARFEWGNATGTLRWNHLFSPKLFLNTSIYYSKYDYSLQFNSPKEEERKQSYDWRSNIQTFGFRPNFTWFANSRHQAKFGADYIFYNFYPGKGVLTSENDQADITLQNKYGTEAGVFAEDRWKINDKWQVQAGIRVSRYQYLGNTTIYRFRDTTAGIRKPLESSEYLKHKKPVSSFGFLEPRLSIRYQASKSLHFKAGYSRSSQYIHLITNTASPTPVDLYLPSSNNIKPSYTDQVSLGVLTTPSLTGVELSAELFYKKMEDLVDYIDNASLELNPLIEADLLTGRGKSYGIELEAKKESGQWQGWVNYTWSKSWRQTKGINKDDWYESRSDRPHIVNASVVYVRSEKWTFSATFNFASGTPATLPDIRLDIQGLPIPYNSGGKRNNYRIPAYHRLDLAATLKGKQGKRFKQEWVFGVYNAYARQNAYSIYFRENEDTPTVKEAVRLSILGSVIPSITWNFKF